MKKEAKKIRNLGNVPVRVEVLQEIKIAAGIAGVTMTEFVSDTMHAAAYPIVRKYIAQKAKSEVVGV